MKPNNHAASKIPPTPQLHRIPQTRHHHPAPTATRAHAEHPLREFGHRVGTQDSTRPAEPVAKDHH